MDFNFTEEQVQLRDAVRRWVDRGYSFERRRAIARAGGFDRAAWNELAQLGLCGLYVPEAFGGLGMGPVEGMVVMEELGRGIVLEPITQSLIAAGVMAGYANAATQGQWLPQIASGQALVTLAYQERAARYRLDQCETKATQVPGGYVLSGKKSLVAVGDPSDRLPQRLQRPGGQLQTAARLPERSVPDIAHRVFAGTAAAGSGLPAEPESPFPA